MLAIYAGVGGAIVNSVPARKSLWTWGTTENEPTDEQRRHAAAAVSAMVGSEVVAVAAPTPESIELPVSRVTVPEQLRDICLTDTYTRAAHSIGGHPMELLRGFRGDFTNPPDVVAQPRTEEDLERVLEWCADQGHATIPYGGGTSVVYGVSPPDSESIVTIVMGGLSRVLEIDETSRAARIQAGANGPDLEHQLRSSGHTMRFFPQSFPWSTLGGWIATRAAGHYATGPTHIDDFVESTRMLTPQGWMESRRLPGSGAGPSPDRLVLGSEGTLGLITEAWVRIQKRPIFRAKASAEFPTMDGAAEAVRQIVQTKLWPSNLRLLDPVESQKSAGGDGTHALLILAFESADFSQHANLLEVTKMVERLGGSITSGSMRVIDESDAVGDDGSAAGAWRKSFTGVNAGLIHGLGFITDTFETAITWDNWPAFDAHIRAEVGRALESTLTSSWLSCRFAFVYPDGPAPYYTFGGLGTPGGEQAQWRTIKDAANRAVIEAGGTITHHHGVGRLHREGWEAQTPDLFRAGLTAVKDRLDPTGILNPGVFF